ncbi:MAG: signal peptide peptidase SppA [Rhodothermales bacterium]
MKRFLLYLTAAFFGTLAALFFLFLLVTAALVGGEATPPVASDSVLDLDLGGFIPEIAPLDPVGALIGQEGLTLRDVTEALRKAAADDRIEVVWLRPEGVSASWAVLSEIRGALDTYRASGKPLIASSGSNGFSEAAYYLASAADSVFTPPEATFELNGFYLTVPFFAGALDKLGVEPEVIRAGSYKSAAETFTNRQFSPENREQYQDLVDGVSTTFRTAIAASRPVTLADLDRIVEAGGLYDARAALAAGLVDGLRYEEAVRDGLRAYTDQDADDELRTVAFEDYAAVTPSEAGLALGDASERIALVYAVGQIMPGESTPDTGSGAILGADTFADALREAVRDETVRAIVVRVDSPGGAATASDAMWHAVREARRHVPVVVSMGGVAASGGYYLAAAADTILADPNTITGSIGVISVLFDATELLNDKLGVTFDAVQTGPAADLGALGQPLGPQERAILERTTEEVYTAFVDRVASGRGLSPDSVRALAGGRVYTGARALQLGLIDGLADLDGALTVAAAMAGLDTDYGLRVLPEEKGFFELLTDGAFVQAALGTVQARRETLHERAFRQQVTLLREAATLHATPQARLLSDVQVR